MTASLRTSTIKRFTALLAALAVVFSVSCSDDDNPTGSHPNLSTTLYTYEIVNVYPHDSTAFTQGLQYIDTSLYEGTGSNYRGPSSLRRVDLTTGTVLQYRLLPDRPTGSYFGEGITVLGDRIFELTWQDRVGFIYDRETFDSIGQFTYPTEGWGLTFDSSHLVMSDGSSFLYFRDTLTFAEVGRVQVHDSAGPITKLNELEYINGEVWANIWLKSLIARIDPETGWVTGWVDLNHLRQEVNVGPWAEVLNGIAYDAVGDRLFVTGKLWSKLFEIRVVEKPQEQPR